MFIAQWIIEDIFTGYHIPFIPVSGSLKTHYLSAITLQCLLINLARKMDPSLFSVQNPRNLPL